MAPKIYLSPAAHEHPPACSVVKGCNEVKHVHEYLDELVVFLDACGILWKRNGKGNLGSAGVQKAVRESNKWGADLHYVVHTNGANGKAQGSRPMVWPTGVGREWAETILDWRRKIYPYPVKVKERTDLYEIAQSKAVCVYEELVFHDNKEDAAWLHNNLRLLAEYTARAFCEIFGVEFVDPYARIPGDVDGDGKVTSTDARLSLQAPVGKVELTEEQKEVADVDGDGKVTTTDARIILQEAVGK